MFRKIGEGVSFICFFFLYIFRPKKIEKMLEEQAREKEERTMQALGFPSHIKASDLPKRCSWCACPGFYYKEGLIRCMRCGLSIEEAEDWPEVITDGTR